MNNRAIAVLIAAGWLAGCTLGPNYHRPAVQIPQNFRAPERSDTQGAALPAQPQDPVAPAPFGFEHTVTAGASQHPSLPPGTGGWSSPRRDSRGPA